MATNQQSLNRSSSASGTPPILIVIGFGVLVLALTALAFSIGPLLEDAAAVEPVPFPSQSAETFTVDNITYHLTWSASEATGRCNGSMERENTQIPMFVFQFPCTREGLRTQLILTEVEVEKVQPLTARAIQAFRDLIRTKFLP